MTTGDKVAEAGEVETLPATQSETARNPEKKKSYGKVALSALFWSYLRSILFTVITIPTTVVLARLLSPTEFGIAAAATFFGQLASNLGSGGMGTALVRVKTLRDDHVSTVFVFNCLLSLIAFLTLMASAPAIGAFYGSAAVATLIPVVGLDFVVNGIFTVPQALMTRGMKYAQVSAAGTCDLFVSSVLACVLAWLGFSYWSLIVSNICGGIVKGLLGSYFVRWRPNFHYSRAAMSELFSFGMGSYVAKLTQHASQNVDNLVIGRVLGLTPLGFYDKGFSVGRSLYKRLTVVGPGVTFRIFAIIQDEPERFRRAYRKVLLSSTLVNYPLFAGLIGVAHPLFIVAFGEKWAPSIVPFQIICVSFMLKLSGSYTGAAAEAHGFIWSQVWRQAVHVVLIAIGVYALSPWGINGAAFGVLIASFLGSLLGQQLLMSITHIGWRDIVGPQIPSVVCSAGMIVVVRTAEILVNRFEPGGHLWRVLVIQLAMGALYYLLFLRFSGFREVRSLVADLLADTAPKVGRLIRI